MLLKLPCRTIYPRHAQETWLVLSHTDRCEQHLLYIKGLWKEHSINTYRLFTNTNLAVATNSCNAIGIVARLRYITHFHSVWPLTTSHIYTYIYVLLHLMDVEYLILVRISIITLNIRVDISALQRGINMLLQLYSFPSVNYILCSSITPLMYIIIHVETLFKHVTLWHCFNISLCWTHWMVLDSVFKYVLRIKWVCSLCGCYVLGANNDFLDGLTQFIQISKDIGRSLIMF